MTLLALVEVEYRRISPVSGRHLRRQLLQCSTFWMLSNVVEVGEGPASLRGYDGGWHFGDRTFKKRELAEKNLKNNGWFRFEGAENPRAGENLTNALQHFDFTRAAMLNIAETDCDALADLTAIKEGRLTLEALRLACLEGADPDRKQGWEDYVHEVGRIADLTR